MQNIKTRIRIGNEYAGKDGVYENSTFAQAVKALEHNDNGESLPVYVVGAYASELDEEVGFGRSAKIVTRKTDEPVFAMRVSISPQRKSYGDIKPAEVNWSALGSVDPETAVQYAELITLAAQIASAVNAY